MVGVGSSSSFASGNGSSNSNGHGIEPSHPNGGSLSGGSLSGGSLSGGSHSNGAGTATGTGAGTATGTGTGTTTVTGISSSTPWQNRGISLSGAPSIPRPGKPEPLFVSNTGADRVTHPLSHTPSDTYFLEHSPCYIF